MNLQGYRRPPQREGRKPLPAPWRGRGLAMLMCCPCCPVWCTGIHYYDCPDEHRKGRYF